MYNKSSYSNYGSGDNYGNGFFSVLKGAGAALGVSLLCSLLFAVILRCASASENIIYPVNQTVKVAAILVGTLLFIRGEKGWLKGGGVGLLFTALSYLAFSALGGDFSLSWLIFLELFFALAAGSIGGIIAVNVKK